MAAAGEDWKEIRICYHYARWTPEQGWQTHLVGHAGRPLYQSELYYAGGMAIDAADPRIICSAAVFVCDPREARSNEVAAFAASTPQRSEAATANVRRRTTFCCSERLPGVAFRWNSEGGIPVCQRDHRLEGFCYSTCKCSVVSRFDTGHDNLALIGPPSEF